MKSEPELAELIASEARLNQPDCEVEMAEKGFGTRVAIRAAAHSGLDQAALEAFLDSLAEPQKRPFSGVPGRR